MKKIMFLFIIFILIISCKKEKDTNNNILTENELKNVNHYFRLYLNKGNLQKVEQLLINGADINQKYKEGIDSGKTPLIKAIQDGDINIIIFLIEKGADVNVKDNEGDSPLIWACYGGNLELVKLLIEKGADVNAKNNLGRTALCFSLHPSTYYIAKILIKEKADVNIKFNMDSKRDIITKNMTLLMSACSSNDFIIVKLLIDNGADVNAIDSRGQTAIFHACSFYNYDQFYNAKNSTIKIIKYLIENKIDLNIKNKDNLTILEYIQSEEFLKRHDYVKEEDLKEIIILLKNSGAN